MAASRVIEQFKVWSPASQGYSFLGDRAPGKRSLNVPRRFMVPSIRKSPGQVTTYQLSLAPTYTLEQLISVALVTLVLLFIFRDIPLSLFGPSARVSTGSSEQHRGQRADASMVAVGLPQISGQKS